MSSNFHERRPLALVPDPPSLDPAVETAGRVPLLSGCHPLLMYCKQIGLDARQLVELAGVGAELLENPDSSLRLEERVKLWTAARVASQDESLLLHVAERAPFGAYRIADFLCATAPNRKIALRKLATLIASSDIPCGWTVVEHDEVTSLVLELRGAKTELACRQAEYGLAVCYHRMRVATGSDVAPLGVELMRPAGSDTQEVARSFGCAPRYGRPSHRIWFWRADLERENVHANLALFSALEEHIAEAQAASASLDPVLRAVRQLVLENLSEPLLMGRAARRLGMSGRSLQRRLRASGTSFSRLVEEAREQQARQLLRSGCPLNDIAGALGFSEHSAFTRAFKRWTGDTPSEYRSARSRPNGAPPAAPDACLP